MTDPLSYLFSLEQFGIKFGLENMVAIVERLGHPERAFRSVHIAGTNGKGSVAAMVDAGLRAAGHRAARYTSPHLVDLTERFGIDGRPVSQEALRAAVADVREAIEGLLRDGVLQAHPTFFEVTTAAAFELFRRGGVDVAVLEVGLGGRLDATNVVAPVLTAITSIAFDHERYLGSTLGDIAREKAGIIKEGVPVVLGHLHPEALRAIEDVARERRAPVLQTADDVEMRGASSQGPSGSMTFDDHTIVRVRTRARDYGMVTIGLRGEHQMANAAVAIRILEWLDANGISVPASAIVKALAEPSWPGRLDLRRLPDGREILMDAAHNPAGAAALASYLHGHSGAKLPLVFAAMQDKDIDGMMRALLPAVGQLVLTRASNRRSAEPERLAERARAIDSSRTVSIATSPIEALDIAWRSSPRIVVAGSIFLLGDVMKQLGAS